MLNKEIAPLKLELVSSYEMQITEPLAIDTEETDAAPAPFGDHGYGKYFFQTEEIRQLTAELDEQVTHSDAVILLRGEQGSGKTVFLQHYLHQTDPAWQICHIRARIALGEKHVLAKLNRAFFPDLHLDLKGLLNRLVERGQHGPFTFIVIDDAENLSSFALKTVFDIKRAVTLAGGRIGVLLAARPKIDQLLEAPSLRHYADEWLNQTTLPALTEVQTQDYILHRLSVAGVASEPFGQAQVRAIHRGAGGRPGSINILANDYLLGRRIRPHRTEDQHRHRVLRRRQGLLMGGLGLVVILFGYSLFRLVVDAPVLDPADRQRILAQLEPAAEGAGTDPMATPVTAPAQDDGRGTTATPPPKPEGAATGAKAGSTSRPVAKPVTKAERRPAPPPVATAAPKPVSPPVAKVERRPAPPPVVAAEPKPVAAPVPTPPAVAGAPSRPPGIAEAPATEPDALPTSPPAVAASTSADTGGDDQAAVSAGGEAPPPVSDHALVEATDAKRNGWLMAQDPMHYTIQLVGFPQASMAADFIQTHQMEKGAAFVHILRGDRDWYIVLLGSFPNYSDARATLEALPEALQSNSPWVRKIGSLQEISGPVSAE